MSRLQVKKYPNISNTLKRDWQKWWRLAGIVRNVRPSKGVTRTVTPCRMLTNVNVENIMRGSQIAISLPLIGSKKG